MIRQDRSLKLLLRIIGVLILVLSCRVGDAPAG
jgi:hypothetical protein